MRPPFGVVFGHLPGGGGAAVDDGEFAAKAIGIGERDAGFRGKGDDRIVIGIVQPGGAKVEDRAEAGGIGDASPADPRARFQHHDAAASSHDGTRRGDAGGAGTDNEDVGMRGKGRRGDSHRGGMAVGGGFGKGKGGLPPSPIALPPKREGFPGQSSRAPEISTRRRHCGRSCSTSAVSAAGFALVTVP